MHKNICVHHLFEQQALRSPHRTAATCAEEKISYGVLHKITTHLAQYLINLGVQPEESIGLCTNRSLWMLTAMMGILKSGASYVPLDPSFPQERLAYIIQDANIKLILTESSLESFVNGILHVSHPQNDSVVTTITQEEIFNAKSFSTTAVRAGEGEMEGGGQTKTRAHPNNLMYTMYTSGTTGKPKGVQIEHKSVVNFLLSMAEQPGFTENDVMFAITTISFDISVLELFLPLVVGGSVCIVERHVVVDGLAFKNQLEQSDATVLQATPSSWRLLIEAGWQGNTKLKALVGGEPLPPNLGNWLLPNVKELWNEYGPTECTVWCTIYKITARIESMPPIGKPIRNTHCYILDSETHEKVPVGQKGELWVGGDCVGRGYKNRPDLTQKSFVQDRFAAGVEGRMYYTGDIGMVNEEGLLMCLGRADTQQVKISGYRIELPEIEAILSAHDQVKSAAVSTTTTNGEAEEKEIVIVGYIVSQNVKSPPSDDDLVLFMSKKLPKYMIPAIFVQLDKLPLLPNGKIDRKALPTPSRKSAPKKLEGLTIQQIELLELCTNILPSQASLDLDTNLLAVGGNSLFALTLHNTLQKKYNVDYPIISILQGTTPRKILAMLPTGDNQIEMTNGPIHTEFQVLTPICANGTNTPLYIIHPAGGFIFMYYGLVDQLPNTPIYGFQDPSLGKSGVKPFKTVSDAAVAYTQILLEHQPSGPYRIAGWSMGGKIAFEMACILSQQQKEVSIIIIDSWYKEDYNRLRFWVGNMKRALPFIWGKFSTWDNDHLKFGHKLKTGFFGKIATSKKENRKSSSDSKKSPKVKTPNVMRMLKTLHVHMKAAAKYKPTQQLQSSCPVFLISAEEARGQDSVTGWKAICTNSEVGNVPGDHLSMMNPSNVKYVGQQIAEIYTNGRLFPKLTKNAADT